jgi:hypothetical protein
MKSCPPTKRRLQTTWGERQQFNARVLTEGTMIIVLITFALSACSSSKSSTTSTTSSSTTSATKRLTLDPSKNYGNKYADGFLPVGDGKYSSSKASAGTVYLCDINSVAQAGGNQQHAGAGTRGPWFVNNNTQWDRNKKIAVSGQVHWTSTFAMSVADGKRVIATNDLPKHYTGTFPVSSSDPAYAYDRNPNTISSQSLTYNLDANPTYSDTPHCVRGEVGVMLSGVALFDAFDAGGRDAGAWEVQDGCNGHPQESGEYHYHTLSSCLGATGVGDVIGFALDGFPITGPRVSEVNLLTTGDLDECHGLVSAVTLDGKSVTTYHYVMTEDFPYSASCFRGTPIDPPRSAGPTNSVHANAGGPPPSGGPPTPPR